MTKVGLVMRKIQFQEAQGPKIFADRLQSLSRELGVEIVFVQPERNVSGYDQAPGFEYEKGDLVNYDIVLDKLASERIEHVIYTVSGFTFLKMFLPKSVIFPHSFPDPALTGYDMMIPFYQMVDKAIVQTPFIKESMNKLGVRDVSVIPIGFEEQMAQQFYQPDQVVANRVLWIGRDEPNRRPEMPLEYARQNPHAEVIMVFGGLRYKESMQKYDIPSNVKLMFALSRSEIFELMNSAKVYWSSSVFDTFAMPLTEALAMGKMVVKPEHACYRHIGSQHAFAGNEHNWFELVNMALAHPLTVSEDNRAFAFEHFTTRVMKKGYERFYSEWLQ